jgi:hypothetical protein
MARMRTISWIALLFLTAAGVSYAAAPAKIHTVTFGPARKITFTPPEATPDNKADEAANLRVRPLFVDEKQKEWTLGEIHDVTDRSFVVRRALHINDALPGEAPRWTWQPGPWLMVDRSTGHITALHLPNFDPAISEIAWFRDYAAYCGLATTAKGGLVAVVAQLGVRKAVAQRLIGPWPQADPQHPVCAVAKWQRTPMRATIQPAGGPAITFDVVGTSSLIEEGDNSSDE